MYVLVVIFVVLSIAVYVISRAYSPSASKQIKQYYLNILFLLLALIMGLRGVTVGADTDNYRQIFNDIASTSLNIANVGFFYDGIEIGFVMYTKILSIIWREYQFFLLISAVIFCFLMKRFIQHSTADYYIASVVFFSIGIYLSAFNIYRQMLAVAILANAWINFTEKQYAKAILLTLLSTTLHVSAIIFIVVYIAYLFRNNKIVMRAVPLLMILVYITFSDLIVSIAPFMEHYGNYMSNHKVIQEVNTVVILWLIEGAVSLFFIYKSSMSPMRQFLGNMTLMYVLMNLIGLKFNYVERLGLYFAPFLILLFCNLSDIIKNRNVKDVLFLGLITCFLIYFLMSTSTEQYSYVSPLFSV